MSPITQAALAFASVAGGLFVLVHLFTRRPPLHDDTDVKRKEIASDFDKLRAKEAARIDALERVDILGELNRERGKDK